MDIPKAALNQQIPRAYMALIISGILGDQVKVENYTELQAGLSDVDVTTKYEYQITRAYGVGILSGYPDGTFRPYGTLTRAEAASVIQRLLDESKRVLPAIKPISTTSGAVTSPGIEGTDQPTGKRDYSNIRSIWETSTSTRPITELAINMNEKFMAGGMQYYGVCLFFRLIIIDIWSCQSM